MKAEEQEWVLTTVDGKVAGTATDFHVAAEITGRIARLPVRETAEIISRKITAAELQTLAATARWTDLLLFGTPFQKKIWRKLFLLTHPDDPTLADANSFSPADANPDANSDAAAGSISSLSLSMADANAPLSGKLLSYSDFAEFCGNPAGVRAVAHAIGVNPISVIIPCHLIVPKETIDRLREIEVQAATTLFGSDGLRLASNINFGEYRHGRDLKRRLILSHLHL